MNSLCLEVNPIPVKTALNMMGLNAGPMRLPLCEMGEANAAVLRETLKEAGLTQKDSTLFPADGTLEWVDDGGVPLPETTVVEANRTYRWRFTPADDNYTP